MRARKRSRHRRMATQRHDRMCSLTIECVRLKTNGDTTPVTGPRPGPPPFWILFLKLLIQLSLPLSLSLSLSPLLVVMGIIVFADSLKTWNVGTLARKHSLSRHLQANACTQTTLRRNAQPPLPPLPSGISPCLQQRHLQSHGII